MKQGSYRAVLLLAAFVSFFSAELAAQVVQRADIDIDVSSIPATQLQLGLTKWTNGVMVRIGKAELQRPAFYRFDRSGKPLANLTFSMPDADRIDVNDFASRADGSIVL